jgi:uncharacterized protein YndB with AHSA1/START domain
MRNDLIVSQSIVINVTLAKVWDALTDPSIIKKYLYDTETLTTWEVGSEIVFQGEYNGQKYRDHGVIIENVFQQKLVYSYWSGFSGVEDKPENYSTIIYTLVEKENNRIEFTWTQKGYATEEGYKHSKEGMSAFLESIKKVMED